MGTSLYHKINDRSLCLKIVFSAGKYNRRVGGNIRAPPWIDPIIGSYNLRGFEILMQKIFEGDLSCDCIWSISYNLRKSWAALTVDLNCGNFFKCSFFKILIFYFHQYQNYERHNDETFSANGPWQMWFSWWFHAEDLSVSIFMIIIRAVLRRFCQ